VAVVSSTSNQNDTGQMDVMLQTNVVLDAAHLETRLIFHPQCPIHPAQKLFTVNVFYIGRSASLS
jgi:hypothetical protein